MKTDNSKSILLLALGNDILGDDGAGLHAGRELKTEFAELIDVVESSEAGIVLMELMEGYSQVLLIDAIISGRNKPGSVLELSLDDFSAVLMPSPHWIGLPEVFDLANRLNISMPEELRILAIEVENPYEVRIDMSPSVTNGIPHLVEQARKILTEWLNEKRK